MRVPQISWIERFLMRTGALRPEKVRHISDVAYHNDGNAAMRVEDNFGPPANSTGVESDFDCGGNLLDALDAAKGRRRIILANAAPRDGRSKNGSPFGAFWNGRTLVIATISGLTLSFVKHFGLVSEEDIMVFDMETVLKWQVQKGKISAEDAARIARTQFRSFEFAPLLAEWLWRGQTLPYSPFPSQIPELPKGVWYVDRFGNCKLSVLPEDIGWESGKVLKLRIGDTEVELACYERMTNVPQGSFGIVVGSSGHDQRRLLEIVRGGIDKLWLGAAGNLHLKAGQAILVA